MFQLIPIIEEHDLKHEEYPGINYYMSKEQQELLMATPPLPVPEGYELGTVHYFLVLWCFNLVLRF